MVDPVSDMLVQIKNAQDVGKPQVSIPFSKLKLAIAEKLSERGFVGAVEKKGKKIKKSIIIELVYSPEGKPRVEGVQRVSKPSRRLYSSAAAIKPVKGVRGTAVLSTPQGILSGYEAKKQEVGGELLFNIW